MPLRPTLLVLLASPLLADSRAVELGPNSWLARHRALLDRARSLQQPIVANSDQTEPVTWPRLLRELRETQEARLVVPASALSLLLATTELISPRLRGQCFDAVLQPGASFALIRPQLRTLAVLALAGWALSIASSILFARARWTSAMAARVRLMASVLEQEPEFFDAQPPGEVSSAATFQPPRLFRRRAAGAYSNPSPLSSTRGYSPSRSVSRRSPTEAPRRRSARCSRLAAPLL